MMGKKILIVDDEAHIRLLLEQALEDVEDEGVEIITAHDGAAGLEAIRVERPELVFLDVMMPEMSGYDVCAAVKGDWGLSEVFVVMLTAKGQEFDKEKGLSVGADKYMTKPFDPGEIVETAKEVLGL